MEKTRCGYLLPAIALLICMAILTAGAGAEILEDEGNESATYTITATAGPDGSIDPAGSIAVAAGENQSFIATPDPGNVNCWGAGTRYVVWNFTVDGQPYSFGEPSLQPVTYTFTDVSENHTIQANFAKMFITARPTLQFDAEPQSGFIPLEVNFTQTDVSTHDSVLWDFGDNTTSTDENPAHTYELEGSYNVSLTIFCGNDSYSSTKDDFITAWAPIVIGGDKGYYLVHCNVDGARVYFGDSYVGSIENGTLLVQVCLTCTPFFDYTVEKPGYEPFTAAITDRPAKDETVDLYAELVPVETFEVPLGNGWNLLSTPFETQWEESTLETILDIRGQPQIRSVLGWNGYWYIPSGSDTLSPLDALYVNVDGSATAYLSPSTGVTSPPSRVLNEGPNLIGSSPFYENGTFPAIPLNQALISINETSGGGTGYIIVISPGNNQPGWGYARGMTIPDILPFKGYWVVMENSDTLYGFCTTPLGG
ncbi:PKD repeat protein [Methanolinea mesophila]|uniref:PKD domain-containing protein n=1 Tax=Methanolinea mesophila TaxID=547055 RepID=UPI001AEA58F0|nr:PKD domain-containing protein [Methanolinea mesophila]MBP1929017.1 PKD repeat protein [Methanolinea mesophila]